MWDLTLWVRVAVPSHNSKIPLGEVRRVRRQGRTPAHEDAASGQELGITFHVGSQTATPEAYTAALAEIGRLIVKAGVVLDRLDVGGGFPSVYDEDRPAPLSSFMRAISDGWRNCRSATAAGSCASRGVPW